MKAERFGLITPLLTLNGLNFSASCDEEGGKKKTESIKRKIKSQKLRVREGGASVGEKKWEIRSGGETERFKERCQPLVSILDSLRIRGKLGVIRLSAL